MRIANIIGLATAFLVTSLSAQDLTPKAAPQQHPLVIHNVTIHPVIGEVIEGGHVVFHDGVITAVGTSPTVEIEGATVVDGTGKHAYPGFVCVNTSIGLNEVGSVDMTIDTNEAGTFTPEVRAGIAVNPDTWAIPVARRNGVLTVGAFPGGGLIAGRASVIRMDGWTNRDLVLLDDAGLVVNWPSSGSGGRRGRGGPGRGETPSDGATSGRKSLDGFFDAASAYAQARRADATLKTDIRYDAMRGVLRKEKPVFLLASRSRDIEDAVLWAVQRGLRPIIVGGEEALACSALLKRQDVPVVLTGSHRLPPRRDASYAASYALPAELEKAGVAWCMSQSGGAANVRNLPYEAAACIAHGLDRETALASVTYRAARCLGIEQTHGSLEVGKHATLFLADGDPFELSTSIERAWIDGREVALTDKQTELYEKYREKYRQLGLLK